MTSRSEISACPSFPLSALWPLDILWPCRSRTCCCLKGAAQGTCVTSDARSYLFLSLSRFLLRSCLSATWDPFLVILCAKTCVCVCVCVQSIFAEAAAVHLLDGFSAFPLFTVLSTLYWFTNMFFMVFWCWCCRAANPSSFLLLLLQGALWRLLCLLWQASRSLRIKYTPRLTCCPLPVN